MPLSPEERERIREIESLKAEIRKEIQSDKPESKTSRFFRHQAVLLVLGFGLTTLVGGALTSWWKTKEWNNQQGYLAQQRALDKKYALMDQTFKEVASTTTAAQDVLILYYGTHWTEADIKEHKDHWRQSSREWRIAANLLKQSLRTGFDDQNIPKTFEELVEKRKILGIEIGNLPNPGPARPPRTAAERKKQKESDAALVERLRKDNDMVNEILGLLTQCGALMRDEIQTFSTKK
jgi:hypothetical protein